MHKYIKNIFNCIMVIIITLVMFNATANIVERKESVIKNQDFISEKRNIDVLFLGTSHVINGVYPMELWDDYGIVSYNLAGHDTPIATSYWVMENALNYTNPRVVVIDCLGIRDVARVSSNFDFTHICFDVFPLSLTKIQAVNDLLKDNAEHSKWDLLFPFSQYHNRWNQLTNADFYVEYNCEKGAEMRVDLVRPLYFDKISPEQKVQEDTLAMKYLKRIISECNERGIEVLLTYLPFPAEPSYQEEANRGYDIAEEYGVEYINFLDMDIVNYETDCYDESSHLNPSGARKVTNYLGRYIMTNYGVQDQRSNIDYVEWSEDYEEYQKKKNDILTNIENPYVYMTMLTDNNYNVIIEITNQEIFRDEKISVLLSNLGIDVNKMRSSQYILVNNQEQIIDYVTEEEIKRDEVAISAGVFKKTWISENNYQLSLNGNMYYDVLIEDDKWVDMRIAVVDNRTQELIEALYYMHIDNESVELDTILCRVE